MSSFIRIFYTISWLYLRCLLGLCLFLASAFTVMPLGIFLLFFGWHLKLRYIITDGDILFSNFHLTTWLKKINIFLLFILFRNFNVYYEISVNQISYNDKITTSISIVFAKNIKMIYLSKKSVQIMFLRHFYLVMKE